MHVFGLGVVLAALALVLAATATGSPDSQGLLRGCAKSSLTLVTPGRLTLATDNPARRPWWNGRPARAPWRVSNPYSAKGYESALAYAVAKRLGFSGREVEWIPVPAAEALRGGAKPFDFYLGQVTYGSVRDRAVDFSSPYYVVPMALLSRRVFPVHRARTLAAVRAVYLAVADTASLRYTVRYIKPNVGPLAYDSVETALVAISGNRIAGLITDLPTAYALRARVPDGVIVGQFPKRSAKRFALVFAQGSKLRTCVNKALGQLRTSGTLEKLETRWLTPAGGSRVLR
jgi:polar amino acid transport system substrate-binding protein